MTANVMYLERHEAIVLLDILRKTRNALVCENGDDAYCTDELLYDIIVEIENELVNYSANTQRVLNNLECRYEKEQLKERNPDLLDKALKNETSWATYIFNPCKTRS